MTTMSPSSRSRRTYDHRLREQVWRTGGRTLDRRLQIPRSTVATCRQRGVQQVVTTEAFGLDRQDLVAKIDKLERRACVLAAALRLVLAILRVSRFRLADQRLPMGQDTSAS